MATEDKEKAEVLNAFFTSVFKSQTSYPQVSPLSDLAALAGEQTKPPTIQEETVRDLLLQLDCHKSMGPDEIHPRVLRELAEVIAEPLSIIYQRSLLTGEVPEDWRLANVTPIYKKGCREDPGNYRPVSLTSVPGKVMEQIVLREITRHVRDNQGIRPSQHGFTKGRSCLTTSCWCSQAAGGCMAPWYCQLHSSSQASSCSTAQGHGVALLGSGMQRHENG